MTSFRPSVEPSAFGPSIFSPPGWDLLEQPDPEYLFDHRVSW
jgi:hypothetical protein